MDASGLTEGAIFRRLWKQRVGPALSPAAVGEIVQRRARLAGLEGDFGGHSLRSGFVTEASRQGVALPAIMQLTEHRSVSSVVGYFQAGGATANPPLLDCLKTEGTSPLRLVDEASELLPVLHDELAERIAGYTIGMTKISMREQAEVPEKSGSGTLVSFQGREYIITADHVVEDAAQCERVGLLIDWTGQLRRCAQKPEFSARTLR